MSFDLVRTLRRLKPLKFDTSPARRANSELPFLGTDPCAGPELLLHTTVYIDGLQDRSPLVVDELMTLLIFNHSAVCLAELTHAFGRLVPNHPKTASALESISKAVNEMPPNRVLAPSQSAWGTAGILAGLAFRLGRYQPRQHRKLLNDALVFLQALENGQVVLTGNIGDFDILNQLVPEGRILLYSRD